MNIPVTQPCNRHETGTIAETAPVPGSEAWVVQRLETAGKTALSMPRGSYGPTRSVTMNLEIVHDAIEAYGWHVLPLQVRPTAEEIDAMYEAFGWLAMIDNHVIRKVVQSRAMVHPATGRYLYGWREIGRLLRADYKAVQRWHAAGIKIIILGLTKRLTRL